ncbi:MAG: hypothetical protein WCW84_09985 [Sulfurimonas sp.]
MHHPPFTLIIHNHPHENETEVASRLMPCHLFPINNATYNPLSPIA